MLRSVKLTVKGAKPTVGAAEKSGVIMPALIYAVLIFVLEPNELVTVSVTVYMPVTV